MNTPYEKDPTQGTLLERLDHAVALATKLRQQTEDLMIAPACEACKGTGGAYDCGWWYECPVCHPEAYKK